MIADFEDFARTMTRGALHTFRFTVRDPQTLLPTDVTLWQQFWVTAKVHVFDADADAVFMLILGNGVDRIDSPNGLIEVAIVPSNTTSLDYRRYDLPADIKGKDQNGLIWPLARWTLTVLPNVTRAS